MQDNLFIESVAKNSETEEVFFEEKMLSDDEQNNGLEIKKYPQEQNTKKIVTESKHQRKWKKDQVENVYEYATEYCLLNNKSANSLTITDFEIIGAGRPQSASECMLKFFEVHNSGSFKPGYWGEIEDNLLTELTLKKKSWVEIAKIINSKIYGNLNVRSGKKCKERWINHLNPEIRRGRWSDIEDILILECYLESPKNWRKICRALPDRTESSVKNRINSLINTANNDIDCYNDLSKGIQKLIIKKRKQAQEQLEKDMNSKSIKERV